MSNYKRFLISFGVFLVLFSVFAFIITSAIIKPSEKSLVPDSGSEQTDTDSGNDDSEKNKTKDKETSGNSFSFIVAGKDMTSDLIDAVVFVKFNKEDKKIIVSSIPSDTKFLITGTDQSGKSFSEKMSFAESYETYGAQFLRDKVATIIGIPVDHYVILDTKQAKNILNITGDVVYKVPENMFYNDVIESIDLKKGSQSLTPDKVIQLLRYRSYEKGDGDKERSATWISFFKELCSQKLISNNKSALVSNAKTLIASCETSFKVSDIKDNIDVIFSFNDYDFVEVAFPSVSIVDSSKAASIHQTYKQYK